MTEKEFLNDQPKQLFKLSKLINNGTISLDDLSDIIPGIMHVNSKEDLAIEYISKRGQEILRYSLEELGEMGASIFEKHQSKHTREIVYPKLMTELSKNDFHQVIPFFQDWQYNKDDNHIYHFTSTKILNENQLISISLFPNDIEYLTNKVNQLFGINKIINKYFTQFNTLTSREKEILAELGKEKTRKEISHSLFISEKTVKKHCENIFLKLGTSKRTDLEKVARAFLLL
jgi:DNA-binding CsgD family transcriptional regulator